MDKAKFLKVCPRLARWTIVSHSSFSDGGDLVVQVVYPITGLIQTDDRRIPLDISESSQRLVETQCGIRIESSSGIVPTLNGSLAGQYLGDRDPFLLPAYDLLSRSMVIKKA